MTPEHEKLVIDVAVASTMMACYGCCLCPHDPYYGLDSGPWPPYVPSESEEEEDDDVESYT